MTESSGAAGNETSSNPKATMSEDWTTRFPARQLAAHRRLALTFDFRRAPAQNPSGGR